ncbi:ribulokinase [Treponema sp. Marseille-Q4130]|uniref:FGGY-family carbohydrate kinase n=1 Tax=Treponema sp. Marseille-Q4130 TaxID=2766702 RepID=UPI0016520964|nr:FGGY-family carbohydrate kinase [Treponema sp. Marseille-Q4130]MBC6719443.1 carbohydrate kinase [Treponema sp. Marseille-Q4130]
MNNSKIFLCADFGTQGVRVGFIDEKGMLISVAEEAYPLLYPCVGCVEQNTEDWFAAFVRAQKKAARQLSENQKKAVASVCICATSSTVIPIDKQGKPLANAVMWMDCRASKQADRINATKDEVLKFCGGESSAEWLIAKVLWIKENKPELYKQTWKFVEQLDWINYLLTDKLAASECNAVCKGHYVSKFGGWKNDFFDSIGFADYTEKIITEIYPVGSVVGYISKKASKETGIPEGIPVYEGGIDAYLGMLGLGVVDENSLAAILGTSFVHLCFSKKEIHMPGIWGPYCNALIKDFYVIEGGQISAGSVIKWFRNLTANDSELTMETLANEAALSGIGAKGLVALDFFQGNRTPYKNPYLSGQIRGLRLAHTRGDIYRALMESVGYGTKNIIDTMEKGGVNIQKIVACGGVTKDPLWLSILADICQRPISLVNTSSYAGIMGCALVSAVSERVYENHTAAAKTMIHETSCVRPDAASGSEYEKIFARYISYCMEEIEEKNEQKDSYGK